MSEVKTYHGVRGGLGLLEWIRGRGLGRVFGRGVVGSNSPLPRRGIRRAAVVMLNETDDPSVDELRFAQIFTGELERLGGVKVVPAAAVAAVVCHNELLIPREVDVLGRLVNAEAVLVGRVKNYEMCEGPKVSVSMEVYETSRGSGRDREAQETEPAEPTVSLTRDYNGERGSVRRQYGVFTGDDAAAVEGATGTKRDMREMRHYLQFVSDRMVRDVLWELA